MIATKDFVCRVGAKLRAEDYAFTVEALGTPWDVYKFVYDGPTGVSTGMIAFRLSNEVWEIGFFRAGTSWTEQQVVAELSANAPN